MEEMYRNATLDENGLTSIPAEIIRKPDFTWKRR